MTQIRVAELEDVNKISAILATSWKTAYHGIVEDKYLNTLKGGHWVDYLNLGLSSNSIFSMVMENDREMIGAAILSKAKKEHEACLISFYLLPDKIRQGFGHIFYSVSNCVLDVLENNKRAIRFYIAHGFIDTGRKVTATLGDHDYTCKVFEKTLR